VVGAKRPVGLGSTYRTMTKIPDRPNTAVLVVDVQNGVVRNNHDREAVLANIGALVERARGEGVPVVWVQHESEELLAGSEEWRIVAELGPARSEPIVRKRYGDSFEDTQLERLLAERQITVTCGLPSPSSVVR
jgi:nicotinamidase-related amidase